MSLEPTGPVVLRVPILFPQWVPVIKKLRLHCLALLSKSAKKRRHCFQAQARNSFSNLFSPLLWGGEITKNEIQVGIRDLLPTALGRDMDVIRKCVLFFVFISSQDLRCLRKVSYSGFIHVTGFIRASQPGKCKFAISVYLSLPHT